MRPLKHARRDKTFGHGGHVAEAKIQNYTYPHSHICYHHGQQHHGGSVVDEQFK